MTQRTDLAIEKNISSLAEKPIEKRVGDVKITSLNIVDEKTAQAVGKEKGKYITLEFPSLLKITDYKDIKNTLLEALRELFPKQIKSITVVGLGNREITADAIGPDTVTRLLATRHIAGEFAESIGLKGLRSVSVIAPNVLGKTGIESSELVEAVVKKVKPDAVLVIDALASKSVKRLFTAIQLSNSGISPGSGVKNSRKELSEKSLGLPVVALGVPTVVDALTLAFELTGRETVNDCDLVVTPKDTDILTHRMSELLANVINIFLQPEIEEEVLSELV